MIFENRFGIWLQNVECARGWYDDRSDFPNRKRMTRYFWRLPWEMICRLCGMRRMQIALVLNCQIEAFLWILRTLSNFLCRLRLEVLQILLKAFLSSDVCPLIVVGSVGVFRWRGISNGIKMGRWSLLWVYAYWKGKKGVGGNEGFLGGWVY